MCATPAELLKTNLFCYSSTKQTGLFFCWFACLLFVWGLFSFIMGREQDRTANPPTFWWWEAINGGSVCEGGMNPWSPVRHSCCWVCWNGRCWLGALRPPTPNPSWREKREFLSCVHTDVISQAYVRKACLCDWVLCQGSLKTLFKLFKWNKTLRLSWSKKLNWHLRPSSFWTQACLAPATTQCDLKA